MTNNKNNPSAMDKMKSAMAQVNRSAGTNKTGAQQAASQHATTQQAAPQTKTRQPPKADPQWTGSYVQQIPAGFSEEQIEQLCALVDQDSFTGGVGGTGNPDKVESIRRSNVTFLSRADYPWVFDRLTAIAEKANETFDFDIEGISEKIQIAVYDEANQGFYGWHSDTPPPTRKISISIPLSDPSSYDGGNLQFNDPNNGQPVQHKGQAVVFASFLLHQVTPVTRGKRYSIVAWIGGPAWR